MSMHAQGEPLSAPRRPSDCPLRDPDRVRSQHNIGAALGNRDGAFFASELDKWFERVHVPLAEDPQSWRFWDGERVRVDLASATFGERTGCLVRSAALLGRQSLISALDRRDATAYPQAIASGSQALWCLVSASLRTASDGSKPGESSPR